MSAALFWLVCVGAPTALILVGCLWLILGRWLAPVVFAG